MKDLIKFSFVIISLIITSNLFSQNLGVRIGMNLSNMYLADITHLYSKDFKLNPGIHLGLTGNLPLNRIFSLETALLFSKKGFISEGQEDYLGTLAEIKGTTNLFYLDIPLNLKAAFSMKASKIYFLFGPYIGIGIFGESRYEINQSGATKTRTELVSWGSDPEYDDIRRYDLGLIMGVGIELTSFQFGINYGFGLANISPYIADEITMNNLVFGLSLGYKFNRIRPVNYQ
ncbi:MAG: PorT family protein [Saprospiraceae bacterium]|nr:PorT family protein [Saprospiraceae bacterium]